MNIIFFHKNCNDGLFSAFSYWYHHGRKHDEFDLYVPVGHDVFKYTPEEALNKLLSLGNPDLQLGNWEANSKIPKEELKSLDMKDCDVYVLDFCFPPEHIEYHMTLANTITVLDHHKTSREETIAHFGNSSPLPVNSEGMYSGEWCVFHDTDNYTAEFFDDISGAMAAWMFFGDDWETLPPAAIRYVSDRDTWQHKYPESNLFMYGIMSIDTTNFEEILKASTFEIDKTMDKGKAIIDFKDKQISEIVKAYEKVQFRQDIDNIFKGVLFNNASKVLSSEACSHFYENGYDFAICYNILSDSKVSCSIRSASHFDCSQIAKMFGGGGHAQAAGFIISFELFTKWMKYKHIQHYAEF